jgi:hypothetical protein
MRYSLHTFDRVLRTTEGSAPGGPCAANGPRRQVRGDTIMCSLFGARSELVHARF